MSQWYFMSIRHGAKHGIWGKTWDMGQNMEHGANMGHGAWEPLVNLAKPSIYFTSRV